MINARHACFALAAVAVALPLSATTRGAATRAAATRGAATRGAATRVASAGSQRCRLSDVSVSIGPRVSPMTGEHAVLLVMAARSGHRCVLDGYPAVRLRAKGRPLRFVYRQGGGPYVTTGRPPPVIVRGGRPAYVLVAKYRCDGGDLLAATTLSVRLPGGRRWVRLRLGADVQGLAYCRSYAGDETIDPGNRVAVSPLEPSLTAAR